MPSLVGLDVDLDRVARAAGAAATALDPRLASAARVADRDLAAMITALQALVDEFDAYYNHERAHQAIDGLTPAEAWAATPPAPEPTPDRGYRPSRPERPAPLRSSAPRPPTRTHQHQARPPRPCAAHA